jgi:CheY-like chemotaxis protein
MVRFLVRDLLHRSCIVWNSQAILVADDDEGLLLMVSDLLRNKGYQVWTARDGLQGCSCYRRHRAQTILSDIDMPELDGFEMMRCIRAINPSARAIYMSGAPERYRSTLVMEAQNFGAAILRKPFKEMDLLNMVSSFPVNPAEHRYG